MHSITKEFSKDIEELKIKEDIEIFDESFRKKRINIIINKY